MLNTYIVVKMKILPSPVVSNGYLRFQFGKYLLHITFINITNYPFVYNLCNLDGFYAIISC